MIPTSFKHTRPQARELIYLTIVDMCSTCPIIVLVANDIL